jgi:hypothetical protein
MHSPQAMHFELSNNTFRVFGSIVKAPVGQTVIQAPQCVHRSSLRVTS